MQNEFRKNKNIPYKYWFVLIAVLLATSFILSALFIPGMRPTLFTGKYANLLNHQIIMIVSAIFIMTIMTIIFGKDSWKFLSMRNKDGRIIPAPVFGIKPKENETWINLGKQMAVVITLITSIVIYFQIAIDTQIVFKADMSILVLLAASNALAEEIIYRFSFVAAGERTNLPAHVSEITSGLVFGLAHYFGNPGGVPGILMAGFIGWFLAKSMNETKGFFWAYVIHFLQDVVIFYALLLTLQ